MNTRHRSFVLVLGALLGAPAFGQNATIVSDPDPDPEVCTGYPNACPQKVPDRTIRPGRQKRLESAPSGLTLSSPMPFWAVGQGDFDESSSLYRFELWGNITNFVNFGEMGVVLWDIALNDGPWGPLHVLSEDGELFRFYPDTGVLSYVGSTGYELTALEQCNGELYGWGTNLLVRINPNTAQTTVVGYPSSSSSGDLMCTYWGTLYGISRATNLGGNDSIVVFSTVYGYSAWTGIDLPGYGYFGGEIDGEGRMFVGRQNGAYIELRHVDLSTGIVSFVASYPSTLGVFGLATFPAAW
jgi:hypothetical protein